MYVLLRDEGVVQRALEESLTGRDTRQKLIERIMVAYIWGEESLDSPRVKFSFENNRVDDLEHAAWLFWSIRGEKLSKAELQKIVAYWIKCHDWAKTQGTIPTDLLAALGHLAWAMTDADGRNQELLLTAAEHLQRRHEVYELLVELIRLVDVSPIAVGNVVRRIVDQGGTSYDYEDRIKALIRLLAAHGQKQTALDCCNKLIMMPGMSAVFKELTAEA
jgi:hypothetical protein